MYISVRNSCRALSCCACATGNQSGKELELEKEKEKEMVEPPLEMKLKAKAKVYFFLFLLLFLSCFLCLTLPATILQISFVLSTVFTFNHIECFFFSPNREV